MKISEFEIGDEFYSYDGIWRCTDVGKRVIAAIKVDTLIINEFDVATGKRVDRTLDYAQAVSEGWFEGPPYVCGEVVFDEDRMDACWPF